MALNWAALTANRTPLPLPDEHVITTVENGVIVHLDVPDSPPSESSTSGGSGGLRKLRAGGGVWVTDKRFIFISTPPLPEFESLTVPLYAILSTKFSQPTFGPNFFAFSVKPSGPASESGLSEGTHVEVRFRDEPMFQFVAVVEKMRERAIYMKRQAEQDSVDEATYTSPTTTTTTTTTTVVDGVPVENPPGYTA